MRRIEKKLLGLIDEIEKLTREAELVEAELSYHRLIDDDAQRDAAVSQTSIDRQEAGLTRADVRRFERRRVEIHNRLEKLNRRRRQLSERIF